MSLVCGSRAEREKACPDTAAVSGRREGVPKPGVPRRDVSTVAGRAGGPARSSGEAPVMGAERRGRVVRGCCSFDQPAMAGRSRVDELKASGKPFRYLEAGGLGGLDQGERRTRAHRGWTGSPSRTFEKDLKNNLYKIWNRMSSGTYFPPPVRAVEIPKPHGGGTRILGVPTVADRVAQTVAAARLEAEGGTDVPPGLLRVPARTVALDAVAACRKRCWETNWVIDLDIRKFFDSVPWDLIVKAVEAQHRP